MRLHQGALKSFIMKSIRGIEGQDGELIYPEVLVDLGCGIVTDINEKGVLPRISIDVEGLRFSYGGTCSDEGIVAIFKAALEKQEPIIYCRECKRQKNIDPSTPIRELKKDSATAKDSVINYFSAVGRISDGKVVWMKTKDNLVDFSKFPPEAVNFLQSMTKDNLYYTPEEFFAPDKTEPKIVGNDKTYHLLSFYTEVNRRCGELEIKEQYDKRKECAVRLLKMANIVQSFLAGRKLEYPLYKDYTHTKARSLIFAYMEMFPFTEQDFDDQLSHWGKRCLTFCQDEVKWANNTQI